jgi:thioredoxin 1
MAQQLTIPPGITLLKFTAGWCGPCRTIAPILDALAKEYTAHLLVVDTDDDPITAQQYDVRSMPTVVLLRDGREVGRVVGARPRAFFAGMLDRAVAGDVAIAGP